jgi:hypothetical protein
VRFFAEKSPERKGPSTAFLLVRGSLVAERRPILGCSGAGNGTFQTIHGASEADLTDGRGGRTVVIMRSAIYGTILISGNGTNGAWRTCVFFVHAGPFQIQDFGSLIPTAPGTGRNRKFLSSQRR